MTDHLQKSVFKTIAFFDLFDYPLTELEVWKFLYSPGKKYSFKETKEELKNPLLGIEKKNGLYFLRRRDKLINIKQERYKESFTKFKIAKKIAKIFSIIPTVKLIAVGNFLPENNTKKESDIDFFIITQKERIWLTRLICVGLTVIFNLRPTEKKKKNKICLTFFASENNLNLELLSFAKKEGVDDLYLFYWIATLYPLYNYQKTYEKFIEENKWLKNYLPHLLPVVPSQKREIASHFKCGLLKIFNFSFWEKLAKKIQLKILPSSLKKMANQDTRVVIHDSILKFHNQDRREEYRDKLIDKLQKNELG